MFPYRPTVHSSRRVPALVSILMVLATFLSTARAGGNPVELGTVEWKRDFDAALRESGDSGKPVFLLFQEVPGCSGCQAFGSEVLSNPLLAEAIENEFIPVAVYNNRQGGQAEALLKRFGEPAWNYQVIRFIGADGRDIIPRKDRVWDTGALAARMVRTLDAVDRPVPRYLGVLAAENDTANHAVAAFAMHCFWTGERKLGQLDGVVRTEAGWLEGREVTRVVYLKNRLTLEQLAESAAGAKCADKVYAPGKEAKGLRNHRTGQLTSDYRSARPSDQKKQIERWEALHGLPGLTPMQLTKINAFAPTDREMALSWLSPQQRSQLRELERR